MGLRAEVELCHLSEAIVQIDTVRHGESLLYEAVFKNTDYNPSGRKVVSADYTITYVKDGETRIGGTGTIDVQ